jgi:hypothetical protein
VRSTQVPEQLVSPLGHWHAPLKHCWPPEHLVPQVPQLFASDLVSVQPMPHAVRPVPQVAAHTPAEHTSVAPHLVAHAPQLSGSLDVSTQAPEQATIPEAHAGLPPVPVVVVVVAPPVPVVVVPPVPVVVPPVPVVDVVPLFVVVDVVDVEDPPELLLHPAAASAAVPAKNAEARTVDAIDR